LGRYALLAANLTLKALTLTIFFYILKSSVAPSMVLESGVDLSTLLVLGVGLILV
jgi:hypothetical protein